ncbi:LPXTG cell wall anchor domain-containing protein [Streptococcus oralis]|uniref:Gram-positive cocci surface proteins LPxTG domain-containing protein n=1 Tax=Streptococcus oralis TaxID=1303 RepID=A0A1L8Q6X4_STROR|nr:LPXTG cell wall anchor domain-containing protein [Streptococcus oralis]MCY7062434.1 LPXTG cell wall anchor domain-containing protein [Streptococcus oralis]OJG03143.1 hypothetical protein BBP19_00730 [Streptococcus oralis]
MKTNKVTKFGISLLSVAALGVVAPALIDTPIFGYTVVKAEEQQEPLKYRISYYDGETGEEITAKKTGVINPGETVNVYKDIDGYEVTSKDSWMPNYEATYDMVATYFHGDPDGYKGFYLDYKKLDADVKPSETPKPEVKPETKPFDTPKPEVKPSEKPDTEAKEQEPIKYRIRYLDEHSREIASMETGVLNPGESINIHKDIEGYQVVSNFSWMPGYNLTYDIVSTYFYGADDGYREGYLRYRKLDADVKPSETPKPEVKPETKPSETPKPEVKPETKPSETPKPEVTPEPKPSETPKPEVKPETKPSETPKPEVKPEPKPSETPKPEVKPEPKPSDTSKPEVKPAPKPSETPRPEVKPAPKPSDTSKPEVKPELKPQTNSNTAPTAPVKPVGQTSNSKADKPTSKKETPALPNTGEQSSSLSLVGLLLASLGLAGLTYKGRH